MLWRLRRFLFFYKTPLVYSKDLGIQSERIDLDRPSGAYEFARVEKIDKLLADQLTHMKDSLPFGVEEARRRLDNGEYFFVVFEGVELVGCQWVAMQTVYCDEFDCDVEIKEGQAYIYNLFVSKRCRGQQLATRLLLFAEQSLIENVINTVWCIIYSWNVASRKAFEKAGYSETGIYRLINILGQKLHRAPEAVRL